MYKKKVLFKSIILLIGVVLIFIVLYLTKQLAEKIKIEEKKKVVLFAKTMEKIINSTSEDVSFYFDIIKDNETIPIIIVDENEKILSFRNIDTTGKNIEESLRNELKEMKKYYHPIEINLSSQKQYVYYKDSLLLEKINFYPYVFIIISSVYVLISYLAFSSFRRAEQNFLLFGLAKETAHQLGTPLSSMYAVLEELKQNKLNDELIKELEIDVDRLAIITERFSKIGNPPVLKKISILNVINNTVNYLKKKIPQSIKLKVNVKEDIYLMGNSVLLEWCLENLIKNSVDSIKDEGEIVISADYLEKNKIFIDIADTGKGISKSMYKLIFKPGFTTKKYGWGLGLTFVKRIIEDYHKGKVFVKSSKINEGTTIRIILNL